MLGLRLLLLGGLVLHKLVWEVLRRESPRPDRDPGAEPGLVKRAVKGAKVAVLGFLVAQCLFLDVLQISTRSRVIRSTGAAMYLVGLAMAIVGRLQLGDNWANIEDRKVLPGQSVVTRGIYQYVRHPIYVGDVLLVTGLQLALNSWLFLGGALALAVVTRQARAEESLLSRAFPEYEAYANRTKMFVPFVV